MSDPKYRELLKKIDEKGAELSALHGSSLRCGLGCHSCCKPDLTIFPVEAEHIQSFLAENPAKAKAAAENEVSKPFGGQRCSFLDAQGACIIYEARPVVCRTHGFPLEIKEDSRKYRDACPLNFEEQSLADLPAHSVFNLQLLNTLLGLIDHNSQGDKAGQRLSLRPSSLGD